MRAVLGHGLLPGLRPVRLHFGFAAERERHDRKRIQDEEGFLITTRPPKRGRSSSRIGHLMGWLCRQCWSTWLILTGAARKSSEC